MNRKEEFPRRPVSCFNGETRQKLQLLRDNLATATKDRVHPHSMLVKNELSNSSPNLLEGDSANQRAYNKIALQKINQGFEGMQILAPNQTEQSTQVTHMMHDTQSAMPQYLTEQQLYHLDQVRIYLIGTINW